MARCLQLQPPANELSSPLFPHKSIPVLIDQQTREVPFHFFLELIYQLEK